MQVFPHQKGKEFQVICNNMPLFPSAAGEPKLVTPFVVNWLSFLVRFSRTGVNCRDQLSYAFGIKDSRLGQHWRQGPGSALDL
jgi:hypothetical protein